MGQMRNEYKILVENSEGKRLLGRPRGRSEGEVVDLIHLTQDSCPGGIL
jgi:hypothetical protein